MALFQCERYPQLIVLDPRDPKRTLARFRDGIFETDDAFTIAELSKREYIKRLDGAAPPPASQTSLPVPEVSPSPESDDRTEYLTALVDEALAANVLHRRGPRVYFNERKVGDSKVNAVHNLRIKPQMVKEIELALERARAQNVVT